MLHRSNFNSTCGPSACCVPPDQAGISSRKIRGNWEVQKKEEHSWVVLWMMSNKSARDGNLPYSYQGGWGTCQIHLLHIFARLKMFVQFFGSKAPKDYNQEKGLFFPNQVTVLSGKVIIETTMTDDLNQRLCQTSMTFICINLLADSIQPVVTLYFSIFFHIFPKYWIVGRFKYFLFSDSHFESSNFRWIETTNQLGVAPLPRW